MNSPVEQRVFRVLSEQLGTNLSNITREDKLVDDLGADSLDQIEIVMVVEGEFGIEIDDEAAERVITVGDVIDLVESVLAGAST